MTIKFNSDIDIDFADRTEILNLIDHVPASILTNGNFRKHASGIYATDIPVDPFTGQASLDYNLAEDRGYVKLDFLNVNLYKQVKNEQHN
jgi:heme oxygenase